MWLVEYLTNEEVAIILSEWKCENLDIFEVYYSIERKYRATILIKDRGYCVQQRNSIETIVESAENELSRYLIQAIHGNLVVQAYTSSSVYRGRSVDPLPCRRIETYLDRIRTGYSY